MLTYLLKFKQSNGVMGLKALRVRVGGHVEQHGRGVDEGNHKGNSLYDGEYSEVGFLMNHDAS